MFDLIIKNATIINEGKKFGGTLAVQSGRIAYLGDDNPALKVHFREPGYTYKADIWHESRAAAAGGITSYMEMPNTNPQTITQEELTKKFELGAGKSLVNYSFYFGATNDNLKEIIKTDKKNVCGLKIFMGSSTGNMLVDSIKSLTDIFASAELPVAVHCEDEQTIRYNTEKYRNKPSGQIPGSTGKSSVNRYQLPIIPSYAVKRRATNLRHWQLSLHRNIIPGYIFCTYPQRESWTCLLPGEICGIRRSQVKFAFTIFGSTNQIIKNTEPALSGIRLLKQKKIRTLY